MSPQSVVGAQINVIKTNNIDRSYPSNDNRGFSDRLQLELPQSVNQNIMFYISTAMVGAVRAEKEENRNNFDLYSIAFIGNIRNAFSLSLSSAHPKLSIYQLCNLPISPAFSFETRILFGSAVFGFFCVNAIAINFDLTFRPDKNVKTDFSTPYVSVGYFRFIRGILLVKIYYY